MPSTPTGSAGWIVFQGCDGPSPHRCDRLWAASRRSASRTASCRPRSTAAAGHRPTGTAGHWIAAIDGISKVPAARRAEHERVRRPSRALSSPHAPARSREPSRSRCPGRRSATLVPARVPRRRPGDHRGGSWPRPARSPGQAAGPSVVRSGWYEHPVIAAGGWCGQYPLAIRRQVLGKPSPRRTASEPSVFLDRCRRRSPPRSISAKTTSRPSAESASGAVPSSHEKSRGRESPGPWQAQPILAYWLTIRTRPSLETSRMPKATPRAGRMTRSFPSSDTARKAHVVKSP